jgi:hypothetical protein
VGLIFIFGARKLPAPAPVKNSTSLTLAGDSSDGWIALNNATLYSLPNEDGFAGQMWITLPHAGGFHPQDWTEKPRWLAETDSLAVAGLVTSFNQFTRTNQFAEFHFEYHLPPRLMVPALPAESPFAPGSTLQIEGDIAKRPLLNPLPLPTWPSTDVIAPSKVQVLVDSAGDVISAVLMPQENFLGSAAPGDPGAGQQADARALELARAARFAPLPSSAGNLAPGSVAGSSVGLLIFNWQTAPIAAAGGHQ